jgi:hypothetical protein
MRTFNTLTEIHEDVSVRDGVRMDISKALLHASSERDQHMMRSRHWLEATTQEAPIAKRREELSVLWQELIGVSGSSGLDQCLGKCSLNPALLSLRQDAVELLQQSVRMVSLKDEDEDDEGLDDNPDSSPVALESLEAQEFIDLLDM